MKKRFAAIITLLIGACVSVGLSACTNSTKPGEHEHTFSTEWSTKDANSHWHAATCEHNDLGEDEEPHDIGDDYRCKVCGYTLTPTEGLIRELNEDGKSYSIVGVDRYVQDTDIVIPLQYEGLPVTGISEGAFSERSSLKSIRMPISLTTIGDNAFYNCVNLMEVSIPNYVNSIGDNAFFGCLSIEHLKLGNSIASIGEDAFAGCRSLKDVNITNLTGWCSVKLTGLGANPFNSGADLLINGEHTEDLVIPDKVTRIEQNVFHNLTLASIALPASVLEIRNNAFHEATINSVKYAGSVGDWCKISFANNYANPLFGADSFYLNNQKITQLVITGSVESIRQYAFAGYNALTSLSIETSETIENNAFTDCVNLADLTIGNTVIAIGDNAFSGCTALKKIELGNKLKNIGYNAFLNCKLVSRLTLPDSVVEIGEGAFKNCINLISLTLRNGVQEIGDGAFEGCYKLVEIYNLSSLSISVGSNGYGDVGLNAFDIYSSEEEASKLITTEGCIFYSGSEGNYLMGYVGDNNRLTLPDDLNGQDYGIYAYAFCYLDNLTEIVIPDSILSIGASAFDNCKGLTYNEYQNGLYLAMNSNPYGIFIKIKDKDATSVSIYDGTKIIADCAFTGSGISSISIPGSVIILGDRAFDSCENLKDVTIPNGLKTIGSRAFYYCVGLEDITLPESVTNIGKSAFFGCTNLKKLFLPDTLTTIGATAFEMCPIEEASIPSTAISFIQKNYLNVVNITSGERIEDNAFSNCAKLTILSIPDSITYVGKNAFSGCTNLKYFENENGAYLGNSDNPYVIIISAKDNQRTDFTLTKQTRIIYDSAFYNFRNLKNIELDGIFCLGYRAFYNCKSLVSVNLSDGATSIGGYVFYTCTSLKSVNIPDSVTYIGDRAFYGCNQLESITIPEGVTQILNHTFNGCTNLLNVNVHENIEYVSSNAFTDCVILNYNTYIGANYLGTTEKPYLYLIKAQGSVTSCTIHEDAKFVCLNAFENTNITSNYIGKKSNPYLFLRSPNSSNINEATEYIGKNAFTVYNQRYDDYTGSPWVKEEMIIPDSVKYLGENVFRGNSQKLRTVRLSSGIVRIDDGAFFNCFYLNHIYYNGTYAQWTSITGSINNESTSQFTGLTLHCTDGNYRLKGGIDS